MRNTTRSLNLVSNLISGLGIILLGLIVTIGSINMYTRVINFLVFIFIIYGLSKLVNFILNKKIVRNKQALIGIIINIILGLIFILFPKIPLAFFPIIFSLYLLINAIVKFISYIILKDNNLKLRFKDLFFGIFFLLFAILFLLYPLEKLYLFLMIIGLYCILLGINKLQEFLIDVLSYKYKIKLHKKLKITLPVFLEAFIPKVALNSINKYIEFITNDSVEKEQESDLQIFIHMSKYGFNQFGHMDILFEGNIYSYGNYDKKSERLFTTLGDGVLFIVNKKYDYIKFCIENSRKTLVEYGIKLTDKEKDKLRKIINETQENTYKWKPEILTSKNKKEYKDYASKLYKKTKAKFYKFNTGEFKTYFVVGVNCTYFADYLLRNIGSEILKLVGIITPGAYYEYLEENYNKRNSKVVSKIIYNKENIGDYYDKNKK